MGDCFNNEQASAVENDQSRPFFWKVQGAITAVPLLDRMSASRQPAQLQLQRRSNDRSCCRGGGAQDT